MHQYTKLPTQPLHCSTIATGQGSVFVNKCNPDLVHKSRGAAVISLETRAHVRLQQLCNLQPDIWGNQVRMVPCMWLLYGVQHCLLLLLKYWPKEHLLLSCPLLPHGPVIDCSHRMMRLDNDQEASTLNPSYPSFNFIFSELLVANPLSWIITWFALDQYAILA